MDFTVGFLANEKSVVLTIKDGSIKKFYGYGDGIRNLTLWNRVLPQNEVDTLLKIESERSVTTISPMDNDR